MHYITVKDVRIYNAWYPMKVSEEPVERISDDTFRVSKRPIVDEDFDGVVEDDVIVKVDGNTAGVQRVDKERGEIILTSPAPQGSVVTATYYWHPVGDEEIGIAIETAEAEIEAITGIRFTQHVVTERVKLLSGQEVYLSQPIIGIEYVKLYNMQGVLVDSSPSYEVVDSENGVVRIHGYRAGSSPPPWYLPSSFEVEVRYQAGYTKAPEDVRHASIVLATYWLLVRLCGQLVFGEDYGGLTSIGFKSEEVIQRIKSLRNEVSRLLNTLPRRVAKA